MYFRLIGTIPSFPAAAAENKDEIPALASERLQKLRRMMRWLVVVVVVVRERVRLGVQRSTAPRALIDPQLIDS